MPYLLGSVFLVTFVFFHLGATFWCGLVILLAISTFIGLLHNEETKNGYPKTMWRMTQLVLGYTSAVLLRLMLDYQQMPIMKSQVIELTSIHLTGTIIACLLGILMKVLWSTVKKTTQ